MRRSTIFSCLAAAVYLAAVYLAVFIVAPANVMAADFVAGCGIAIPHPSGWNRAIFDNSGTPVLHITVTALVAIVGYGAIVAGCAFYFGEHEDARAQADDRSVAPAIRRRAAASPDAVIRRDVNTQIPEGDVSHVE